MERHRELIAAVTAAVGVFLTIVAPWPMIIMALGLFGAGLATHLSSLPASLGSEAYDRR